MAYDPTKDFAALLRQEPSGAVELARAPQMDIILLAFARAGLFKLYAGQTAPTSNQSATMWLRPSSPSWVAEGAVFLWDAVAGAYVVATPALFFKLLSSG